MWLYIKVYTSVCLCVMASWTTELRCCVKYYTEDQSWWKEKFGQPTVDFSYKTKLYTLRTEPIRIKH
jgi:hypothetical protein